jgi:hypothetical protein
MEDRVSRLHPAIALDQITDFGRRPRRRKPTKRERQIARLRRERAELRRRLEAEREPVLEPLTGALTRLPDPWGPAVRMGANLRVQAAVGHRAAVIELKPGLFLVAEVPEAALRPEFGFVPLLAPMIMNAATSAIGPITQAVQAAQANRQARPARPQRAPRQAAPAAAPAPAAPLALPGPVAAQPAAAPVLGWADDVLVGEVVGCDKCGGGCGR